jgi:hypothetical protein
MRKKQRTLLEKQEGEILAFFIYSILYHYAISNHA